MFRLFVFPIADSFALVAFVALALRGVAAGQAGPRRCERAAADRAEPAAQGRDRTHHFGHAPPDAEYTEIEKGEGHAGCADRSISRSLTVPDALAQQDRWDALRGALDGRGAPALRDLSRDFEVGATPSTNRSVRSRSPAEDRLARKARRQPAAMAQQVADVQRLEAGKRLLGMILLSDSAPAGPGTAADLPPSSPSPNGNTGRSAFHRRLWPIARARRSPGHGRQGDLGRLGRVREKRLSVTGQVSGIDGYVNRDIPVRLLFEDALGKMEVVDQQTVRATADGRLIPVHFTYDPPLPGEFELTLEAVPQPGELVTTNNRIQHVRQRAQGRLAGVGYRRRSVGRGRSFSAMPWPLHRHQRRYVAPHRSASARTQARRLGRTLQPGKYEVVILHDVDATACTRRLKALSRRGRQGTGLIMLGGRRSFGAGGYSALADVLPVLMDRLDRRRLDGRREPISIGRAR